MSVVSFFSAKGAPGTTTAAMLTASLWSQPVLLADCDPAGGDMALRLPTPDGRPLDLRRGVLSLLPVARRSLSSQALLEHAQQVLGGGEVLAGMTGPEQAAAGGPVWSTIASAFGNLADRDVIIDAGRVDAQSPVLPLVAASEIGICVLDGGLSGVFSARGRLRTLIPLLRGVDARGTRIGLAVRAGDAREAEAAADVIREEFPDALFVGALLRDPVGAGIFDGRPVARPERTLFVRSGRAMVEATERELARMHGRTAEADVATGPDLAVAGAPATPARRSRVEERHQGQRSRFRRSRAGSSGQS